MSEKLCLKWNDIQENVNAAFGSLREDNDFDDVTLARVDIWRDRCDRRSRKNLVNCVNFEEKDAKSL